MRGYDEVDYAASRLLETIIRYKDEPVLVRSVKLKSKEIWIECTSLLDDENNIIQVPLSDCDINPVSLGYVNHGKYAHYIMRAPMRRDWRQGLRMLNIVDSEGMNPRLIPYRTIAQTIMGRYPSFKSALEKLTKGKINSMAYSRDFCVNIDGGLYYKGLLEVGKVEIPTGNVLLHDKMSWVREAFDESMEAV